jgi:TRAP-type C4-dicarboxylate transport system substrate-binding protein
MGRALISMFAVIAAALAVSGCAADVATTTTMTTSAAVATVPSTEPASSTTTSLAPTTTTTSRVQERVTLRFATAELEDSVGGDTIQYFCDYVEDETAGLVKFDIAYGSAPDEVLAALRSDGPGEADLLSFSPSAVGDQFPLLAFPWCAPGGAASALDYFNYLVFENEDTSSLIAAEADAQRVMLLGCTPGGGNAFMAKDSFAALADLAGRKFGVSRFPAAFQALGYDVVEIPATDAAAKLADGTIAATEMGFGAAFGQKCQEVAKYYMWDGSNALGDVFAIALATWDSLAPKTQQVVRDAAKEATQHGLELDAQASAAQQQAVLEAGATVGTLGAQDQSSWWESLFASAATDSMSRAERLGMAASMTGVLKAASEFTNAEWTPAT